MTDPVAAAGVAIGTVSLAIQLLDACSKGYRYLIAADNMEKDCGHLRVRLQIEYARLQDWRKVSGLAEYKDGQDFPDSLKAYKLELVAILTQIHILMTDFAEINGRYEELQLEDQAANQNLAQQKQDSALAEINLLYDSPQKDRSHHRGLNHLAHGLSMIKNVAKHPRRLCWVGFDEEVFLKLLGKLTEFNDYLQELMYGHQAQALQAATQRSFLEIVQVRTSIEELKHLVMASILLSDDASVTSPSGNVRLRQNKALESLARFKEIGAANEAPDDQKPSDYKNRIHSTEITTYSAITYPKDGLKQTSTDRTRTEGEYELNDSRKLQVWIEWKSYVSEWDEKRETYVADKEHVDRVKELVALLSSDKPSEFCAPTCLGFFDDRKDCEKSENELRFGLVYQKPREDVSPVSLHHLIKTGSIPPLSDRIQLAHKTATCVLYLHAVNWLHKALRSDSVLVFPKESKPDFENPLITGYEYARPDRVGETTTGAASDPWWELYAHPKYQGSRIKGHHYCKTYDIYSLGIILLEIAYWESIESIMDIDPKKASRPVLKGIRERLLAPDSKYLDKVSVQLGDRYRVAVESCLQERSAFGIKENDKESDVHIGAKLQERFTALVVDPLKQISV